MNPPFERLAAHFYVIGCFCIYVHESECESWRFFWEKSEADVTSSFCAEKNHFTEKNLYRKLCNRPGIGSNGSISSTGSIDSIGSIGSIGSTGSNGSIVGIRINRLITSKKTNTRCPDKTMLNELACNELLSLRFVQSLFFSMKRGKMADFKEALTPA